MVFERPERHNKYYGFDRRRLDTNFYCGGRWKRQKRNLSPLRATFHPPPFFKAFCCTFGAKVQACILQKLVPHPGWKKKRNLDRYGSGLNTPWDYHLRSSINKRRRCEGEGRSPSGLQHASNFCKMCERQIRPARSSLLMSVVLTNINEYLKK